MSNEKVSSTTASNNNNEFAASLIYSNARLRVKFNGDFLRQNEVTYNHGPIVNIYFIYRLIPTTKDSNVTLQNCLFGAVKLTKYANIHKYKYSGYGIGFDSRGSFTHPSGEYGRNVIIFGADMSHSVHVDNKKKYILIPGKGPTQGLDNTTLTAEKMYSLTFAVDNKEFCLSLHYNGDSSYLFVIGKEINNFKAKDSETVPYPLCLGGLSKDFGVSYMRATGLAGYVYGFSVDYSAIASDKILDIHKCLMEKNSIV